MDEIDPNTATAKEALQEKPVKTLAHSLSLPLTKVSFQTATTRCNSINIIIITIIEI